MCAETYTKLFFMCLAQWGLCVAQPFENKSNLNNKARGGKKRDIARTAASALLYIYGYSEAEGV
jgi:hypothetical protein